MAINYINAVFITRSKGHNALDASAYRANENLYCERTGKTFDYTNKTDCVYKEILLPSTAFAKGIAKKEHPLYDREKLWNKVEEIEASHNRHATAQLAIELKIALPKELNQKQKIELLQSFIRENYVDKYDVAADIAIHDKGDHNPHAHVLISFRKVIGLELSKTKVREVAPPVRQSQHGHFCVNDGLQQKWTSYQNEYFQKHEIDLRVDEGYIIPTVHEGRVRDDPKYYDKAEDNLVIKEKNAELVKSNPEIIIETLQSRHAVFTDKDIKSLVFKTTAASLEENAYEDTLKTVMASPQLVSLGYAESGHLSYTTKATYNAEIDLAKIANRLSGQSHIGVYNTDIERVSKAKTLTDEQHNVLKSVTQSGCLSLVVGRAGAGKTHLMGAVKSLYDTYGIKVYGAAIAGKAAEGLEADAGIESRTLDSLLYQYAKGSANLPEKGSVLVLDEAGMVGLEKMHSLLNLIQERNLKLIAVGDPDQLQPIAKGSPFRAMLERVGFAEIQTIFQQKNAGDRQASTHLAAGEIGLAIDHYLQKDAVTLDKAEVLKEKMIAQWGQYSATELNKTLMLAFTRDQVAELNALARDKLKSNGLLQDESSFSVTVSGESHHKSFAVGDRIILLKNKKIDGQSLKNGMLGCIESIDEQERVAVRLDDKKDNPIITFNASAYNHFDHGYAVTVHKAQGATKDNVLVYTAGRGWDRFLAYVGLSRHKHHLHLYADIDSYEDIHALKRTLAHTPMRDNVLDYPLQFAIRRGYDAEVSAHRASSKIRQVYEKACDTWNYLFNYEAYKLEKQNQQALLDKQILNKEAKAVADLADMDLHCKNCYRTFVEEYGKEWYNNTEAKGAFSTIDTLFYQRNKMAHEILPQYDKFKRALALNRIAQETLTSWSVDYISESRVKDFYITSNPYQRGKLAQAITDDDNCKRYVAKQNLWREVGEAQTQHVLKAKSRQIDGFAARLNIVESYLDCIQQASRYWKKSEAEHFDSKADGELPHQAHYANLSKVYHLKAEALAEQMHGDLPSYKQVLAVKFPYEETYHKVLAGITSKIERFEKRQVIRAYIDENTPEILRERAAFTLNQDFKGYVGIGYEEGLVWSSVAKIAHPEKMRQFRAELSPTYQAIFDHIEDYKVSCRQAAEAFVAEQKIEADLKNELGIQKSGDIPKDQMTEALKEARQTMYQLMAVRHEAAFNIAEAYPILREWASNDIAKFDEIHPHLDARKFMRHVGLHEERLAAQARVEAFAVLGTEADQDKRMALAYEINQCLGKHMFFLQKAKIAIDEVTYLAAQHQYNLDNAKYTGDDKILHRSIADYMLSREVASKAWREVKIAKHKKADITQLQQQAFALAETRNQAAFEVYKLLTKSIDSPVYEVFTQNKQHYKNIDIGQLIKQANDYRIIDEIKSYQAAEAGTYQSKFLAGKITEQYAKGVVYHKLKALGVDSQAFYQDAITYRRDQFRFDLTTEERNCHDTVLQYIDKVQSTAKAYGANDKALGKQLIAERDALAYRIAGSPHAYQDALLFEQVNLEKLDQHVERFCKKQLAVSVADEKENRTEYAANAKAHEQPFSIVVPQKFSHAQKQKRLDAERINDALMGNPFDTYIGIFGQPKKQSSRELRYSGGLIVSLHGRGAGKWYDFSADKGGYPVQALMYQHGLSYQDALAEGAKIAGLSDTEVQLDTINDELLAKRAAAHEARIIADQKDLAQRIESAQSIWATTMPIKDTLAERYMAEHRHVYDISKTELRFFPIGAKWIDYVGDDKPPEKKIRVEKINKTPAMVVVIKDEDRVVGVQRTYLDRKTADKNSYFDDPKLSKGTTTLGTVVQKGESKHPVIYIAEGVETAASAGLADPGSTCIASLSVSNMKNMTNYLIKGRHDRVVLLKDNDGVDANSDKEFNAAVDAFKAAGISRVVVKEPKSLDPNNTNKKTDWNDVLQHQGVNQLKVSLGLPVTEEYDYPFQSVLFDRAKPEYAIPDDLKDSVQADLLKNYLIHDYKYCCHLNSIANQSEDQMSFAMLSDNPYTKSLKEAVSTAAQQLLSHPKGAEMAEMTNGYHRVYDFASAQVLQSYEIYNEQRNEESSSDKSSQNQIDEFGVTIPAISDKTRDAIAAYAQQYYEHKDKFNRFHGEDSAWVQKLSHDCKHLHKKDIEALAQYRIKHTADVFKLNDKNIQDLMAKKNNIYALAVMASLINVRAKHHEENLHIAQEPQRHSKSQSKSFSL